MSIPPVPSDKQSARDHFLWQERVLASDLSPAVVKVAIRLALFRNIKSGRCDPSYAALAEGAHVSERTAIRAIGKLERDGWLTIDRGNGRGNRNQFALTLPPERVTLESGFTAEKGDSREAERVTERVKKGDRARQKRVTQLCHSNTKENMLGLLQSPQHKRERDVRLRSHLIPIRAAGGLMPPRPDSKG